MKLHAIAALGVLVSYLGAALAQEAVIRKNLAERIPSFSNIQEISKTPMNDLYEVRLNDSDIFYTDSTGNFLLQGNLIDTRARRNLTEERIEKLSAVDFKLLPLKDAFTVVRGNGSRKLAVFEDPNCGYCKTFERDLQKVNDVTVYMFLFPFLGPDSVEKSKNIWCAKDKGKAWVDWMVHNQPLTPASCDTAALKRNIEFGQKYKISATPTLVFADGSRRAGAMSTQEIEKTLGSTQAR